MLLLSVARYISLNTIFENAAHLLAPRVIAAAFYYRDAFIVTPH